MFNLKQKTRDNVATYLQTIRPWAMGVENRGWLRSDFYTQGPNLEEDPTGLTSKEMVREDVMDYRTDPTHVIFPLLPYEITVLDRLFLNKKLLGAIMGLNQALSNFNSMVDAFNRAPEREVKWHAVVMLHTGLIGTADTNGLYDHFMNVLANL
jgi:hypothetical protein